MYTAGKEADWWSSAFEPGKAKFLVQRRDSNERKLDIPQDHEHCLACA